jgi:hypothetical protein
MFCERLNSTRIKRLAILFAIISTFAYSILSPASSAQSGNPPPQFNTDITFTNNTMVDFSATSGEPIIRVDKQDNIFVTSPFGLSTTVSLLWKSIDGGRSFIPLGTPIIRDAVTGGGGGDTHVDFDDNNWVYYVDLSGACVTAAVSTDGGNTFPVNRVNQLACVSEETNGATDDRQWVAGFGNGTGYVTFRNLQGSNFYLFKTSDGGLTWDKGRIIGQVAQSGPLMVDKQKRRVTINGVEKDAVILYQIFYTGNNLRVFRIMDFTDGTPMKVDNLSIVNPGQSVANVFPVLAVDRAGNLYAVWSQAANSIWMTASTNRGDTWSAPVRVSTLTGTNIMPWIVAGDPGRVDIIWYRSPMAGNPAVPASTWDIFMAQSLNALSGAATTFTPAIRVNQNTIHRGQICLEGLFCDATQQDRSFLEYPSISMDSKGAAVITYNDNTNQVEAPYVMVAKQTSGPSLLSSVGYIKGSAGAVNIARPAANETVRSYSYTVGGAHTIPPKNFDKDESGDARYPDHGATIGANISALDIQSVSMSDTADSVTVMMQVADLTNNAVANASTQSGGDGVLYLTQMDVNDAIYWVAAEYRAGLWRYMMGNVGLIRSGTSKKFITYNADPVGSLSVQGQLNSAAPGTITLKVPRSLIGNPQNGAALYTVTGFTMSERGPILPVPGTVPNPTSMPIQVDSTGAFAYTMGEGPRLDGLVEVSLDDASFASPRAATLVSVTSQDQWQVELNSLDLIPGQHTLYARQRINGREVSPVTSVQFTVSDTVEQIVNQMTSLQASNASSAGGVSSYDLRIKNTSTETIFTPLRAEIAAISSASGSVATANADNQQTGAGALWDYSDRVGTDAALTMGELSLARKLRFNNPNNEAFTVTFNVIGNLTRTTSGGSTISAASSGSNGTSDGSGNSNSPTASNGSVVSMVFRLTYNPLLNVVSVEIIRP